MQRLHPSGRIGRVVEQARSPVAYHERIDQRGNLMRGLRRMAAGSPRQHTPQILGRAGIAPEIVERPALEEFGSDLAAFHLCGLANGARSAMVWRLLCVNSNRRDAVIKLSIPA